MLLRPLGFRSPKGTDPGAERAMLDSVADELAYLSDDDLAVLARLLAVHGDGAARCFWPSRATFTAFAHMVRPRPLDQDPKLVSWFASIEGPRMLAAGTLVETWMYFERHRMLPVKPGAAAQIAEAAAVNARRLQLVRERLAADLPVPPVDAEWARRYAARRDELVAMVEALRAGKGAAA